MNPSEKCQRQYRRILLLVRRCQVYEEIIAKLQQDLIVARLNKPH